ncbi:hypothetical protein K3495_g15850 [Podosphaera aphanis]|nr:hypothetical protein K3495_g15850 [Podosphaera aphanis]
MSKDCKARKQLSNQGSGGGSRSESVTIKRTLFHENKGNNQAFGKRFRNQFRKVVTRGRPKYSAKGRGGSAFVTGAPDADDDLPEDQWDVKTFGVLWMIMLMRLSLERTKDIENLRRLEVIIEQ